MLYTWYPNLFISESFFFYISQLELLYFAWWKARGESKSGGLHIRRESR